MNIVAISSKFLSLFVAAQNKIFCFPLQRDGKISDMENPKILKINESIVNLIPLQKINFLCQVLINQLYVQSFQDQDFLMCVDMNAKVTIFNVQNLDYPLHEFEFFFKKNKKPIENI